MKQIKRADLHMHSTFSDGVEEPEELVVRAKNNGVELILSNDKFRYPTNDKNSDPGVKLNNC